MGVIIRGCFKSFQCSKTGMYEHPFLTFMDYTNEFLLETDASKEVLGAVMYQKQVDGQYHPVTYSSRALMAHEKTTIQPSLSSWC